MHAIQPPRPSLRPVEPAQRKLSRVHRSNRRQPHQSVLAVELSAKLGVNLVLAIIAGVTLVRLLPYNLSQQAKLRELETEVALVESRVDQLKASFDRHFDPQQTRAVMQEQSNRVDPHQRQVIWVAPAAPTTASAPSTAPATAP